MSACVLIEAVEAEGFGGSGVVASAFGDVQVAGVFDSRGDRGAGNQFGGKWLVHQGTLVRWLRGSYREPAAEDPGR